MAKKKMAKMPTPTPSCLSLTPSELLEFGPSSDHVLVAFERWVSEPRPNKYGNEKTTDRWAVCRTVAVGPPAHKDDLPPVMEEGDKVLLLIEPYMINSGYVIDGVTHYCVETYQIEAVLGKGK